jgi:hypothetical protein
MSKSLFFLIFFFNTLISFSQIDIANCIVIIDKKIDCNIKIKLFFKNNNFENDSIDCSYSYCHLKISNEDYNKLLLINDTSKISYSIIYYEKNKNWVTTTYIFNGDIWLRYLKEMKIVNISTFNKKKNIYYIDIRGDSFLKAYSYEKKYGSRKKFNNKIYSVFK